MRDAVSNSSKVSVNPNPMAPPVTPPAPSNHQTETSTPVALMGSPVSKDHISIGSSDSDSDANSHIISIKSSDSEEPIRPAGAKRKPRTRIDDQANDDDDDVFSAAPIPSSSAEVQRDLDQFTNTTVLGIDDEDEDEDEDVEKRERLKAAAKGKAKATSIRSEPAFEHPMHDNEETTFEDFAGLSLSQQLAGTTRSDQAPRDRRMIPSQAIDRREQSNDGSDPVRNDQHQAHDESKAESSRRRKASESPKATRQVAKKAKTMGGGEVDIVLQPRRQSTRISNVASSLTRSLAAQFALLQSQIDDDDESDEYIEESAASGSDDEYADSKHSQFRWGKT